MRITKYKDIYFIENNVDNFGKRSIKDINVDIDGMFCNSQLKSLGDVKEKMYNIAKRYNGNAIINFKYGQKSTFLKSIFGLDDVCWYGKGLLMFFGDDEIRELLLNNKD